VSEIPRNSPTLGNGMSHRLAVAEVAVAACPH